jgi:GDP-L-fucose synthase
MSVARSDKIYVAGHRGLAGSALVRRLRAAGFDNLRLRTHGETDLIDQQAVRRLFADERPDHVLLAAARTGGILANNAYAAEFIQQNLAIQTNVIHEAWRAGVKRLLFLGSSCVYPRECPQPMKESYLLTGPLESTNRPYAVAKIAGIEMCWSYNRQYGTRFLAVMPTNLYGPGDNYDLQSSHVLAALIRKAHEAKLRSDEALVVWGTGTPRREFLNSDDMADACVFLLGLADKRFGELVAPEALPIINVGAGKEITIRELAETVAEVVGFRGKLVFDASNPDGTPRKLLDVSRLEKLGWRASVPLRTGIEQAYRHFQQETAIGRRRDQSTMVQ